MKYKNLVLIGNGFDCWQGLNSSYEQFRIYYLSNVQNVAKELGYELFTTPDGNTITAVELIYGNPFKREQLQNEFFWSLESRMDKLDDQQILLFFGRDEEENTRLQRTVDEAVHLLRRVFVDWIATLDITEEKSEYLFSEDTFFINFNYTDTLEKRLGIDKNKIFHIHGEATNPDSILVGHAAHPETAFEELKEQQILSSPEPGKDLPRIRNLYYIEDALYKTDKHVADNIDRMCMRFAEVGLHIEDIENIYVLGHSFAEADREYFNFLNKATRCGCDFEALSAVGKMDQALLAYVSEDEDTIMAYIMLNLQYAFHHRERLNPDAEDPFAYIDEEMEKQGKERIPEDRNLEERMVKQRFYIEQAQRTQNRLKELTARYGVSVPLNCHSILGFMRYLDDSHRRNKNAEWHITYYSGEDKQRIKRALKEIHIKNYKLYSSIDECIAEYRV